MNSYELTLILRITESLESLKEVVKKILEKHEVQVQSEDEWGSRKLAYQIDKEKDGHYWLFNIDAPPEAAQKVTNDFRLNTDILRHLFVKLDKKKA